MKAVPLHRTEFFPMVTGEVILDIAERVFIFLTFGYFAWRAQNRFLETPDLRFALLVLAELIPIGFLVFRPITKTISRRPSDWLFAVAGSAMPLFITMAPLHPLAPGALCYILIIGGIGLQLFAKVFLGLSFGVVAANRGVKIGGPYSFIRHPMYAGYTLSHIGLLLAMPSLVNAFLYAAAFSLQLVRMTREEAILRRDGAYRDYSQAVRFRLIPGIY